jgi:large subunit ribosomal protein L21
VTVLSFNISLPQGSFKQKNYFLIKNHYQMFAIVTIAGQQFKVSEGQAIFVHRLEATEGSSLTFDQVHLVDNGGNVRVGTPTVAGASVKATVLAELVKGDKVIVFKKKRRKGYRIKKGHRQQFTRIQIDAIAA